LLVRALITLLLLGACAIKSSAISNSYPMEMIISHIGESIHVVILNDADETFRVVASDGQFISVDYRAGTESQYLLGPRSFPPIRGDELTDSARQNDGLTAISGNVVERDISLPAPESVALYEDHIFSREYRGESLSAQAVFVAFDCSFNNTSDARDVGAYKVVKSNIIEIPHL